MATNNPTTPTTPTNNNGVPTSSCLVPNCLVCPEPKLQRCQVCNAGFYIRSFSAKSGFEYQECYDLSKLLLLMLGLTAFYVLCYALCYLSYSIGKR